KTGERTEVVVVEVVLTIQRVGSHSRYINFCRLFIGKTPGDNGPFHAEVRQKLITDPVARFEVKKGTCLGSLAAGHCITGTEADTERLKLLGAGASRCNSDQKKYGCNSFHKN